ncbi:MAG: response regulator transcription factor [Caldilineaceae bacterium]
MTTMQTGDDPRVRVLVTDDQSIVRQGLGVILSHAPGIEVVGFAENGQQAVEMTASTRPDLVLMDLKMPVMNGIHATRAIVQQFPQVKVLVLTTYDGDEWLFDAITQGVWLPAQRRRRRRRTARHPRRGEGEVHLDPHIAGKVIQAFAQRPHKRVPRRHTTGGRGTRLRSVDRTRAGHFAGVGPGQEQPGDRRNPLPGRRHRQKLRQHYPRQTPRQRPHPSRHHRPQARAGNAGIDQQNLIYEVTRRTTKAEKNPCNLWIFLLRVASWIKNLL